MRPRQEGWLAWRPTSASVGMDLSATRPCSRVVLSVMPPALEQEGWRGDRSASADAAFLLLSDAALWRRPIAPASTEVLLVSDSDFLFDVAFRAGQSSEQGERKLQTARVRSCKDMASIFWTQVILGNYERHGMVLYIIR